MTLSHNQDSPPAAVLADLLRGTPIAAARYGLFTVLHQVTCGARRERIQELATPLREALGVASQGEIGLGLADLRGRPPKAVMQGLLRPALAGEIAEALEQDLGKPELAATVRGWGDADRSDHVLPALDAAGRALRRQLAEQLLGRTAQLRGAVIARGRGLGVEELPVISGKTLPAASGAWQLPQITGKLASVPGSGPARHPNRLARASAAVAYVRARSALRSRVPDSGVVDPLLLLATLAESVLAEDAAEASVVRGRVLPRVRTGDPSPAVLVPASAWAVLDTWGATNRQLVLAIPTAWKLPPVYADVFLWAACSAACRLAVAAEFHRIDGGRLTAAQVPSWEDFLPAELPTWEAGARHAWSLMQSMRQEGDRTEWPGCLLPDLSISESLPWGPIRDPWQDV